VARRLTFDAGRYNLIPPMQFAGRRNASINDAALTVVHDIQRAWQRGLVATVLTFDISGYFNNIQHSFLVQMLEAKGFPQCLVHWVESFLSNRTIAMSINEDVGEPVPFNVGVPQGSPLSPCFSSFYTADLIEYYSDVVVQDGYALSLYMYIDDGFLMCISPSLDHNVSVIRKEIAYINTWLKSRGLGFEAEKSDLMHFSRRKRDNSPPITITDSFGKTETIVARESLRWLGVFFDRKLSFKQHVHIMANRSACKVAGLRMLGNTVRGLSQGHLRHLYKAIVVPTLTFAAAVWYTGVRQKALVEKLEKVQNAMLRQICGGFRTSPIAALQFIASIPPLEIYLDHLRRNMSLRLLKLQSNSTLLTRLSDAWRQNEPQQYQVPADAFPVTRRKKCSTNLEKIGSLVEPESERMMPFLAPPWRVHLSNHKNFHFSPPSSARNDKSKKEKKKEEKEKVLGIIRELDAKADTIVVYTDGSVSEGQWRRAGVGVSAWNKGSKAFETAVTARREATSFDPEMYALVHGLSMAMSHAAKFHLTHIAIFSDSSSALASITDYSPRPGQHLSYIFSKKAFAFLDDLSHRISLYWTPSHCGVEGNERADKLAKEATRPDRPIVFNEPTISFHKAHSKRIMTKRWTQMWGTARDKLHLFRPAAAKPPSLTPSHIFQALKDKKEVFGRVTQALTGHGYIGEYYHRFGIDGVTHCEDDECLQTRYHILAECSRYQQHRLSLAAVSENMSLQVLFSSKKGLRALAVFLEESGAFTKDGRPYRNLDLKDLLASHIPP
jgi:ribonuclease HI